MKHEVIQMATRLDPSPGQFQVTECTSQLRVIYICLCRYAVKLLTMHPSALLSAVRPVTR